MTPWQQIQKDIKLGYKDYIFKYHTDSGSIAIGNVNYISQYYNGVGAGIFYVVVRTYKKYISLADEVEAKSNINKDNTSLIDIIRGKKFNIYRYDKTRDEGILCSLTGKYELRRTDDGIFYLWYLDNEIV